VGLLGTKFTMIEPFFREGLERSGIKALVPEPGDQQRLNDVIYQELCRGEIRSSSRQLFLDIIEGLRGRGAEGIVLGCTEIPLLVEPKDCAFPLFNTALLHAAKALEFALQPAQ
jgi:aspartate racemase